LAKLRALSKQRYIPAVYFAFIYVALNKLDRAFECLHAACEERSSYLVFMTVQPSFENLRSDPRFEALLKKIRMPSTTANS
jgi:adenylate cyclase